MNIVTLTTDFGTSDWFVGTMTGVVLNINPRACVVNVTHEIPAGDIRDAAFVLAASCRYFPKNTVHVAVVDPGVGGPRKAVAVRTTDYFFVGPDNGVLSFALAQEKIKTIRLLENEALFLQNVGRTFHGRDIFAPVAAYLSRGLSIERVGPPAKTVVELDWPAPRRRRDTIEGEIVRLDRFGNAITNIPPGMIGQGGIAAVVVGKGSISCPLKPFYQAVAVGKPVAVVGSHGYIELAVNGGSAAKSFWLRVGDGISVKARC
jgi:S-adenosylmethionine hydrolase